MKIFLIFASFLITYAHTANSLSELQNIGLISSNNPVRLHLGCGENRIPDYVNIDFPPSEHTIQTSKAPDFYFDITKLHFPDNTVEEVRNHHVFEHFDRFTALALLCAWHQWLKVGGTLCIETPDFDASIKLLSNRRLDYSSRQAVLRHLFGSHEAGWAVHWDGWYAEKFVHVLEALGYGQINFEFTEWKLTRNIIVHAKKMKEVSIGELQLRAKNLLKESTIDNSASEQQMWQLWCSKFDQVLSGTID